MSYPLVHQIVHVFFFECNQAMPQFTSCTICGGTIAPDITGRPLCYGCGSEELQDKAVLGMLAPAQRARSARYPLRDEAGFDSSLVVSGLGLDRGLLAFDASTGSNGRTPPSNLIPTHTSIGLGLKSAEAMKMTSVCRTHTMLPAGGGWACLVCGLKLVGQEAARMIEASSPPNPTKGHPLYRVGLPKEALLWDGYFMNGYGILKMGSSAAKCECGSDAVGSPAHSEYCPRNPSYKADAQ